jgi:lipid-A-disaccharide synthase
MTPLLENHSATIQHLLISTGDTSAVQHIIPLIHALKRQQPDLRISVVGNNSLAGLDVELIATHEEYGLGVWGLWESFKGIKAHLNLADKVVRYVKDETVDRVLLVDYGGYHLRLAKRLAPLTDVHYYIAPQLWATRKRRVEGMKHTISHVYTILPMEDSIYEEAGIPHTFVGHPLVESLPPPVSKEAFCATLNLEGDLPLLGLFPGSRKMEVKRLLPIMAESLTLLRHRGVPFQCVVSQAPQLNEAFLAQQLKACFESVGLAVPPVAVNQNHALLSASDVILGASGTTSLEAALYGTPMVITYKVDGATAFIARRIIQVKYIGLPNLLVPPDMAPVLPERIQENCHPELIARDVAQLLNPNSPERAIADAGLCHIRTALGAGVGLEEFARTLILKRQG